MSKRFKQAPLWKRILIILLVIALPLFFAFFHSIQIQQALRFPPAQPQPDS